MESCMSPESAYIPSIEKTKMMNEPSQIQTDPRPLAYSYIRFSTPEQSKGDSLTRQTTRTKAFCETNGYRLVEEMQALGVSAFRGANLDDTAILGQFLNRVRDGKIPRGSVLVVESFDRISRDKVLRCQHVLMDILLNGVGVAPLSFNGQILTEQTVNDNPTLLILAICEQWRGGNESKVKSERILEAFSRKRPKGELCGTVPYGWDAEPTGALTIKGRVILRLVANLEEQRWILWMVEQRSYGIGYHTIAKKLNELGVPTKRKGEMMNLLNGDAVEKKFTSGKWQAGNVQKVLNSKTTLAWLESRQVEQQKAA